MTAYYNENNKDAAAWLRNLMAAGEIAPGIVDERSIEDVRPTELAGYAQCHFFAGVGVWSHALRRAGIPDDYPVWTGSCPCQPFSAAGKGDGFDDERHLWPAWFHLIGQCLPAALLGEQVASKDAQPWIDLVHTDLEALGYAFGAIPFPAAGIGAPHIRDRLYWVAHAGAERQQRSGEQRQQPQDDGTCRVADAIGGQLQEAGRGSVGRIGQSGVDEAPEATGPVNGFWRVADWLRCRDERWRPVESSTFPLAHGLPASMAKLSPEQRRLASLAGLDAASLKRAKNHRVVSLRGYGNAIVADAAVAFIESVM